jgi:hypothetical protein
MKATLLGLAPALSSNITLGWKTLPEKNTKAYLANSQVSHLIFSFLKRLAPFNWIHVI